MAFTFLYLSLSYYLLPSIAIILKIRKRKLTSLNTVSSSGTDISSDSSQSTLRASLNKVSLLSSDASGVKESSNVSVERFTGIGRFVLEAEVTRTFTAKAYSKISDIILL